MNRVDLYNMDCRDAMSLFLPDNSVDAIVCDPPYGLSFMGKKWDYDVPGVDIWAECLRVLKPGGHLLAFAGTRTQHRMAVRIEDAGFEIRDMIAWVYGSGFPKSLDVSKQIDKAAGAERGTKYRAHGDNKVFGEGKGKAAGVDRTPGAVLSDPPVTEAARQWQGWGTSLKPSMGPITVARKPLGTCATNVLQMVESQLRERGVRGEILWKPESASGAARSKKTTNSGSTRPLEPSGTSAKTADGRGTQSVEQQSQKSSERHGISGLNPTLGGSESFHGFTTSGCENPLSPPTAGSAPAAESVSVISSPSTTSTAGEHGTENKFTGRSTHNCAEKDSRLDTASFAGIATGLTGSMGTVHISRDSEGFFLWPKGLPEFVPGSPLTVAANVLAHGTGGLNIDGCRVGTSTRTNASKQRADRNGFVDGFVGGTESQQHDHGRWPANLIHDGSSDVVAAFPQAKGQQGALTGSEPSSKTANTFGEFAGRASSAPRGDTGSAARFFYAAKASKKDRDEGLESFVAAKTNDGRAVDADNAYQRGASLRQNIHPTVKPTDLMAYLCRLVTPPGGVVFDPFMGSGSTGKAALREGFGFIGCEMDAAYFAIAEARLAAVKVPA